MACNIQWCTFPFHWCCRPFHISKAMDYHGYCPCLLDVWHAASWSGGWQVIAMQWCLGRQWWRERRRRWLAELAVWQEAHILAMLLVPNSSPRCCFITPHLQPPPFIPPFVNKGNYPDYYCVSLPATLIVCWFQFFDIVCWDKEWCVSMQLGFLFSTPPASPFSPVSIKNKLNIFC